jgi:hypothetical protein
MQRRNIEREKEKEKEEKKEKKYRDLFDLSAAFGTSLHINK